MRPQPLRHHYLSAVQHSSHFLQAYLPPCLLLLPGNICVTSVLQTPRDPVNCHHSCRHELHGYSFRPCQLWDGDVEGAGQDGRHRDAEGGRGGWHRRCLPEVRRRHQGAWGAHEEHGEQIYILESLRPSQWKIITEGWTRKYLGLITHPQRVAPSMFGKW